MSNLLEKVTNRHGGLEVWNNIESISLIMSFGGLAFTSRFQFTGNNVYKASVFVKEPKVVLHNFIGNDITGIFTKDKVWLENINGEVLKERISPRQKILKFRRQLWWDSLDLLYFAGYALWNYITFPYLLNRDDISVIEIDDNKNENKIFSKMKVTFPQNFPTHSTEQIFYFNKMYDLIRHDYDPVCYAGWAKAAQLCNDYKNVSGIYFPFKRNVYPRDRKGNAGKFPKLVYIKVEEAKISKNC